jgi:hypothetical protein
MLHILGLLSGSEDQAGLPHWQQQAPPGRRLSRARLSLSGPQQESHCWAAAASLVHVGFPGRSLPGCSDDSHESRVTEGRKEQQHNVATNRKFFISKLNKKFDQ